MTTAKNCFEVIAGVDEAMTRYAPDTHYFVLGGIPTSALTHPGTVFNHDNREIWAPKEAADATIRPNGTRRDIDLLVAGVLDDDRQRALTAGLTHAVEGELTAAVFGFDRHRPVDSRREKIRRTAGSWVSKRTIDEAGIFRYELFPLEVEVRAESYEPWTLCVQDTKTRVSVLHPVGHALAYDMRSISGQRKKDQEKIARMREQLNEEPDFCHAATPQFDAWRRFANAIQNGLAGRRLRPGEISPAATKLDQRIFRIKGNGLATLEANQRIVRFAQEGIGERILGPLVGSR